MSVTAVQWHVYCNTKHSVHYTSLSHVYIYLSEHRHISGEPIGVLYVAYAKKLTEWRLIDALKSNIIQTDNF